ncbi:hypothetical protein SAMN03097699_0436 [Flavobacteriaceae bacterium MAR_2010_188]|nr:hypothetical protein SAMN03097699_0436 [Flavobacteriaceae bacterium MAR_2010_188]
METKDIAEKWASMCKEGKNLDFINEYYSDNVSSREMPGMSNEVTTGKQNVWNKNKEWLESVEEVHDEYIGDPVVADKHFTSKMVYDVTFKKRGRQKLEEIGVYQVENGKIASEQFFYSM